METDEARQAEEKARKLKEMEQARKFFGFIIGLIIVFFAQRDLRRRSPELIRGSLTVWRIAAMVPPGAVAYLLFGRRRVDSVAVLAIDPNLAA
jgi:hypothetical protein